MEELINNNQDYTIVLIPYITEIITNSVISDKVRKLQLEAIVTLKSRLSFYKSNGYIDQLLCAIARKRAAMIMCTTSKTEMENVMRLRPPYYNGNRFVPDKYNIPEEEIILWAETSFGGPLNSVGFKRYMELLEQIFPEQAITIFKS